MRYIATFYSHFGATRYKKLCQQQGYPAKLMPVPRDLSSSCGTCVAYEGDSYEVQDSVNEELEQIVACTENGYQELFRAADS